jgi:glycosyltransferase involved in cell wall biosynthesis/GT2 family glycosyltransferase
MDLVSLVIPCYNPGPELLEAVRSARAQTHKPCEIILVDDGTDTAGGKAAVESALPLADRFIRQPNCGLPSARNAGFRAAGGKYVVPLDSDDLLDRCYVAECLAALRARPDAAFVYTDARVFGTRNYVERYGEYNLYALLDRNILPYAALIRKEAWEDAGHYDDRMRLGFEDWEFWLRLGAKGRYGFHLGKILFRYRKHGPSLFDVARRNEREIIAHIQANHPELYGYEARARIKAIWEPAACVLGPAGPQSILDCELAEASESNRVPPGSRAPAFAISKGSPHSHAAEFAALAVWGGAACAQLPGDCVAISRRCLESGQTVARVTPRGAAHVPGRASTLHRHLHNAGLLSARNWLAHPLRSASRLVPLRLKEAVNRRAGRPLFDLSFYLQFQPASVMLGRRLVTPLRYMPRLDSGRRRIALVTPHLGPGGAEKVLLEFAGALDRSEYEIFLIATQSSDARWLQLWQDAADHVYDLAALAPPELAAGAFYSVARNWRFESLLIQNSLPAYSVLRELKAEVPEMRVMDLIHSVDEKWDVVFASREVACVIDVRIAVSEAVRERLRREGTPDPAIRLLRCGIDLARFTPAPVRSAAPYRLLFAGRLDPVKRPLLLVDIARALKCRRPGLDFKIVVAGDGPEAASLRDRIERARLGGLFEIAGHVPDIAPLLANADLLVLASKAEGIPLVILEAFAAGKPVVASNAGAVGEVVNAATGVLIERAPGEAEAFAEAIDVLLNDPDVRARMGREARSLVERDYSRDQFRLACRGLLGGPSGARSNQL